MTTPTPPPSAGIPGLDDSPSGATPVRYPRHALGLPAGSVRALIAFMVLGALWLLAWAGTQRHEIEVTYVYLQYVMILILAHYFASHGSTIGKNVSRHSPLHLPSGSVRFLLLAGYLGLIGWLVYNRREFEELPSVPLEVPLVLLGCFLGGFLLNRLVLGISGGQLPYWFQDVQAWLALLAVLGLVIIVIVRLFIDPGLRVPLDMRLVETIVAGIVGFYFGARS